MLQKLPMLFDLLRVGIKSTAVVLFTASLLQGTAALAAVSIIYTYDALGRVATARYDNGTCIVYTYDANGNRTAQTITTSGNPRPLSGALVAGAASPGAETRESYWPNPATRSDGGYRIAATDSICGVFPKRAVRCPAIGHWLARTGRNSGHSPHPSEGICDLTFCRTSNPHRSYYRSGGRSA